MSGPRSKNWCFTLNNYTDEDVERLSNPITGVQYLIFGKEVGASGTPHLQGTVIFQSRKRLSQLVELLGQCHFSVTRFVPQSIEYCKKDGDFIEVGDYRPPSRNQGTRNDLEEFKNSVKEGIFNLKELRELHSEVIAKYPRFVADYIRDNRPEVEPEDHPLRPWQSTLYEKLQRSPDPREIAFIVDRQGNTGKSWFARRYLSMFPDTTQIIIPGKKADMAFIVREECRVFFFDCPRSKQGEFIQYDFLEELKNGFIFSPKYESVVKKLKPPHVVVLMNERPDMEKLSNDRYSITMI